MKYLSITILFLIFFSQPLLAEIWDFGLGIVFVPGRMENYDPAQIEIGASSVKGYGLSVSKQATKSFENLTKEEKAVLTPTILNLNLAVMLFIYFIVLKIMCIGGI